MNTPRPTSPTRRAQLLAAGAATVTVVLWASAFVSIRSAGAAYSPGALALGRLLAGAVALGAVCLVRREGWPPRAAWRGIAISGLLWFGFYMVVLNWGEQQVDAGTAALVVNTGPILIALLGSRLLGDAMPPRLLAGMAVSFAGAVAVGLSMSGDGGSSVLGVVLCLLAAVGYAAGVVAQKPALGRASALQVTTFGCLAGAVVCLPFAGQLVQDAADAPVSATLNMLYLGLFPTALAFTTWAYALARTTASRMGATTYAVPALVVLMSWLFLDEVPGLLTLAGGALCLAGVAVSRSRPRAGTAGSGNGKAAAPVRTPEPQPEPEPEQA
ncbi:DMT family transporter [Streptomyces sp. NBC_01236]|uniref:DMT family transporter n=1 Tax=Streptomyces sp. NBC_01236 TaxID=2903789 RepID=UPI002E0EF027|nr:DMT family transporter [Streptomyces sp. NBC_01236]